ncbi:MAG: hydantoinase B/oxoprolinase family protein [Proteobacteria bacterium]|nr:hydantoinase B/oxoprolinase family protein [Pseudomonadota bacterium]
MKINPVRRELLNHALVAIADNVLVMIVRTARSSNVKNSMDFSAAILDADGVLVAQGLAVPVHLGAMMPAMRGCLDYFGDDIVEGDVLATNDPYSGGSHLNDIFTFKPVYVAGRRIAWIGIILHHTDLGGRVPGGNATDSNEIFEEGLRIPPTKIVEAGVVSRTLMRIIEFNTRVPDRVVADVRAQLAAIDQAEKELHKLLQDWTAPVFTAYLTDLVDYAERLARAQIAALPDGVAQFTEWNDDDGIGGPPVRIHVTLTKQADRITIDFSDTDRRLGGAVHSNYVFTASCAYAAVRTVLDIDIPSNAGIYRPIEVIAPEGTFLNAPFPAALGSRGQSGQRIRSVVLGALAQLMPDRMTGCPGGSEFAISVSGYHADRRRFLHLEFHNNTGQGGGPDRDGQDAGPYCIGNLANVPVELIEAEVPLRIESYAFLPDTGGPGLYRGALAIVREYRILADEVMVQVRSDRFKHAPWGIFGGGAGASARAFLNPDRPDAESLPSKFIRRLVRGDLFRAEMAAAGGYGDPIERPLEATVEDVRMEKISPAHARDAYGVMLRDDGELDVLATQRHRQGHAR